MSNQHSQLLRRAPRIVFFSALAISSLLLAQPASTQPTTRRAGDSPEAASRLNAVGTFLGSLGQTEAALKDCQAALEMRQRLYGNKDNPDVVASLYYVGLFLQALGRPADAVTRYEQSGAMYERLYGAKDDPKFAIGMTDYASCLYVLGRWTDALAVHERVLGIRQRLAGDKDNLEVAQSLRSVSLVLLALGHRAESLPKAEQALAICQRLSGAKDDIEVALSLATFAQSLEGLGRAAEAYPKIEQALAIEHRLYGEIDTGNTALGLENLATCLRMLGRYDEALPNQEQAMAMGYRLCGKKDNAEMAIGLNNLACCLVDAGRTSEALSKFEDALAMGQRLVGGRDNAGIALALGNIGYCLDELGRPQEALPRHQQSLAMVQRLFGKNDHPGIAMALGNLALTLQALGRNSEAAADFEQALAVAQRVHAQEGCRYASLLGRLQLEQGQPGKAVDSFKTAIEGLEQARLAIGGTDQDRMKFFSLAEEKLGPFRGMVAAQLELGRADLALEYLERGRSRSLLDTLERGDRLQGGDVLGAARKKAQASGDTALVAQIEQAQADLAAAEDLVAQKRAILNELINASADASRLADCEKNLGSAEDACLAAQRVIYNLAAEHGAADIKPLSADQIQASLGASQRMLVFSVSSAGADVFLIGPSGTQIIGEALHWADGKNVDAASLQEAVTRYLSTIIREGQSTRGARLAPEERDQAATQPAPANLGNELFQALIPKDVWEKIRPAEVTYIVPDGALERLPLETLLVSPSSREQSAAQRRYWLDEGPPLAYGPSATVLVNRLKAHREQVERFAAGHASSRQAVLLGDGIFQRIARPVVAAPTQGLLVNEVKPGSIGQRIGLAAGSVIVSLDGHPMTSLDQFQQTRGQLLLTHADDPSLPLPQIRFWREGQWMNPAMPLDGKLGITMQSAQGNAVALGGHTPDVGSEMASALRGGYANGNLPPLPGTRVEVETIYQTLAGRSYKAQAAGDQTGSIVVLLGEDATNQRLSSAVAGARYVHLATHGLMEHGDRAVYSSVALTEPMVPTQQDTGFLTLADLFDNWWGKLADTQLVVLSACDSVGDSRDASGGEGVFGLPWGFMYAGSPAVIASLWEVDDASTAQMMGHLYQRLQNTSSLQAFVGVRKELRAKRPEPFFWAPFVYIGCPD
jgi:tetratricopeptide (TPR) repeat protein